MATFSPGFCDAIAVVLNDDNFEEELAKWSFKEDEEWMTKLESVIGRYWRVADNFKGHPAFKREACEGYSDVFLVHKADGWYFASSAADDAIEHQIGYFKSHGFFPTIAAHLPYWSKKPNKLVSHKL